MYDIKLLEEEWARYKKKKMRPWYILIFIFILLASSLFFNYKKINFFEFNNKNDQEVVEDEFNNKNDQEVVTNKSTVLLIDKALTQLATKKPTTSKVTEINSLMGESSENRYGETMEDLPIPEDVGMINKPIVKINTIEKSRKKIDFNIIETSTVSAYEDVAKRFNQSHDTDDSLFLAQSYYRKGNYEKAEYWALQTNKFNESIEESWLIFAKSKMKLGHKNEAIRILTIYIKKSNSVEAKKLLHKIKQGTL